MQWVAQLGGCRGRRSQVSQIRSGVGIRPHFEPRAGSEAEGRLKVQAAVGCGAGGERASLQGVGDVKQARAQNRVRVSYVEVIEDVADAHAEHQVVAAIGIGG